MKLKCNHLMVTQNLQLLHTQLLMLRWDSVEPLTTSFQMGNKYLSGSSFNAKGLKIMLSHTMTQIDHLCRSKKTAHKCSEINFFLCIFLKC